MSIMLQFKKKKILNRSVLKIWNRRDCQTPFTLWLLGAYYVLLSVQGYEESMRNQIKVFPPFFDFIINETLLIFYTECLHPD